MLPSILFVCISDLYLYWHKYEDPPRDNINYWSNWDGTPIVYNYEDDLVLHFFFGLTFGHSFN